MSTTIYVKERKVSNKKVFDKIVFIMNALENRWKIKKTQNSHDKYIFYKRCDEEIGIENKLFLEIFVESCLSIDKLFSE
jgi:hypothetical protein